MQVVVFPLPPYWLQIVTMRDVMSGLLRVRRRAPFDQRLGGKQKS